MFDSYRLRMRRKQRLFRAFRKRRELVPASDNSKTIRPTDILLFCTLRNERIRLPYFMEYYRDLGVDHFIIVDNDSKDGSREYLAGQSDVSVWRTGASYKQSRYGMDWMNWLLRRYGTGHWCLTVDVDEFLIYPFSDTRPVRALTDWLDVSGARSFSSMLLDMYPNGAVDAQAYQEGQDPLEITQWFDSGNYVMSRNPEYHNLWIQGGARARHFFGNDPQNAPSLNKIPLVKWEKSYAYAHSTHMLLPRGLNLVYDDTGGEKASGILLHTKFLNVFLDKTEEETKRQEHFSGSREYKAYYRQIHDSPNLWCKWSEKYINWRQLEILGLMSKGNWA